MSEVNLHILSNVSEPGSHLRCCATRNKSCRNFDLFISYPLMFLDKINTVHLLVMHGTAWRAKF